jgi:hypothetical protein
MCDIKEIRKLTLNKNDMLVVKVPKSMPADYYVRFKRQLSNNLPGVRVMIISDLFDIGVISQDAPNEYSSLFSLD